MPTADEVAKADRITLGRWCRFLIGETPEEIAFLDTILAKFRTLGGFSPEISKRVGWNPNLPYQTK